MKLFFTLELSKGFLNQNIVETSESYLRVNNFLPKYHKQTNYFALTNLVYLNTPYFPSLPSKNTLTP